MIVVEMAGCFDRSWGIETVVLQYGVSIMHHGLDEDWHARSDERTCHS